jgi:hypothetical protein
VDTTEGYVGYRRMRYTCHKCGNGYYPFDLGLELSNRSRMSQRKERQLSRLAARLPYEEAKSVYEELSYQKTGRMTIHRTAQVLGGKLKNNAPRICAPSGKGKKHVTADGALIHIRSEGWKEAQVGAVYHVNASRKGTDIVYTTGLGKRAALGDDLYNTSGAPEAHETRGTAFVSDAAKWLDEIKELHFPLATRIVDEWHAREYLWDVANHFYETGSQKAKLWGEEKVKQLKAGNQQTLRRSLSQMKPRTKTQKEVLKDTKRYFQNHGHKMDYPRYKKMGFHTGSGVAEGACKFVIQSRFKRAGMRWSRTGAENLLALRTLHVNQRWDLLKDYQRN